MITIEESYELFMDTLSRLDNCKLELADEDLVYEIFEELDSEYHSFFHEYTVDKLINASIIPSSLRVRILNLRKKIKLLMEHKSNITLYRNDPDWRKVRIEANSIIEEIKGSLQKS